jgi:RNA polymerase sigma-70 factor, ECF subfamily
MDKLHPFHVLLPQQALPLRRRALKLSANPHRAEDLVQATLLKAWINRDRFQPGSNLRAWLFTILRNTFFSELRKYRLEVEDVDDAAARAQSEAPRQEDAVALRELMAAMATLPDAQRRPIILTGAFGYSQLEASDACGCTIGTIKSRVSRGRAVLSRILAHDEILSAAQASGNRTMGSYPANSTTHPSVGLILSRGEKNPGPR